MTNVDVATPPPSPVDIPNLASHKMLGRILGGMLAIAGAAALAALAFGRLTETVSAGVSPSREQLMLAFLYIAAAACVATVRGFISIGLSAGGGRARVMLVGIATTVIVLIAIAAVMKPAAGEPSFWIALSLPIVGSYVEDLCVVVGERRVAKAEAKAAEAEAPEGAS